MVSKNNIFFENIYLSENIIVREFTNLQKTISLQYKFIEAISIITNKKDRVRK